MTLDARYMCVCFGISNCISKYLLQMVHSGPWDVFLCSFNSEILLNSNSQVMQCQVWWSFMCFSNSVLVFTNKLMFFLWMLGFKFADLTLENYRCLDCYRSAFNLENETRTFWDLNKLFRFPILWDETRSDSSGKINKQTSTRLRIFNNQNWSKTGTRPRVSCL